MSRIAELRARLDALRGPAALPNVEELFTSRDYFGVTTATPLQRAVCRIADGRALGDVAFDPHVQAALSSWVDPTAVFDPTQPIERPTSLVYLAGTRCGKTRFAVALAVRMALACDLKHLEHGEVPRVPIVSLSLDLAAVAFSQLSLTCTAQPKLKALLLEEPTAGRVVLRHPSGRPVEIMVSAGKKAGGSLIARWVPGVIFDEAPRMLGSSDGAVVNLSDMRSAVQSRLLPGAIVLELGSPWAPFGPVYETAEKYHGKPADGTVVIRAKGWWLNPSWWTEAKRKEMAASKKPETVLALRTDGEAEFATPEESMYSHLEIERATRSGPVSLPREKGQEYVAAMDPATRGNAWTLEIGTRRRNGKLAVAHAQQWVGSKSDPLSPRAVLSEINDVLLSYGLREVDTDQYGTDFIRDMASDFGFTIVERAWTAENKWQKFKAFGERLGADGVELAPVQQLGEDLKRVKRRVTQNGIQIVLPKTADGRHCDYAPTTMLVLAKYLDDPAEDLTHLTPTQAAEREVERDLDDDLDDLAREKDQRKVEWYKHPGQRLR